MKSILYQQNQIATACQISFPIHKNAIGACFKPLLKTRQKYTHCQFFNFERSFQLWLNKNHKCFQPFPTKHGLNSNHLGEKKHHLMRVLDGHPRRGWWICWPVDQLFIPTISEQILVQHPWLVIDEHKIRSINRSTYFRHSKELWWTKKHHVVISILGKKVPGSPFCLDA